jgi:hypothetical protein
MHSTPPLLPTCQPRPLISLMSPGLLRPTISFRMPIAPTATGRVRVVLVSLPRAGGWGAKQAQCVDMCVAVRH